MMRLERSRLAALLAAGIVAAAAAAAAAPAAPPAKEPPKPPLTMELVPGAVVLDRADGADVFVLVGNAGATPLRGLAFRLHVPADVTNVEERWEGSAQRTAGSAAHAARDLAPLEQRVVKVTLVHRGAWTAVKSATFVVEAAYTWHAPPSTAAIAGDSMRPLTVKIGALEGLSVLGVPLALAIFIVPGLLGLSLFAAPLRAPVKWIDDNKLFVSFLGSVLLILFWHRFLRPSLDGPDLWSGVSIELLLAFTVVAGLLGGIAGLGVRSFQRTPAERWPVTRNRDQVDLLANLAERGMLPASSATIRIGGVKAWSAVAADTDLPDEIVLLPRRYRIDTTDEPLRQQFRAAIAPGGSGEALARLLRQNRHLVKVADGIKQPGGTGTLDPAPNGTGPIWIPREGVSREPEDGGVFLIGKESGAGF